MRRRQAQALLLDITDLHERDRIVSFVTPEFGRKRGVARGARTKFSRFAGRLQPLAQVDLRWFERDSSDLVRIEEVSLVHVPEQLYAELEGILLGSYLAEHIGIFAQEDEPCPALCRLVLSTLVALESGVDRDVCARYFEVWVLRLAGIFPAPRHCPECLEPFDARGARLPENGDALVCPDCFFSEAGGIRVGVEVLNFLARSASAGVEEMAQDQHEASVLRQVEGLCASVRRYFLGFELRSYGVMQRTLAEVGG